MWSVLRGGINVITAVLMAAFAYLTYVNTVHEQARRKAATVEVSTTEDEPATATITVTAKRPPRVPTTVAAPNDAVAPSSGTAARRPQLQRPKGQRAPASKLFAHAWHLPLSNRDVWLQRIAGSDSTATFVVRDVTGPVQQPIGFGTARGNDVRITLRVLKEAAPGEFVKRDATLRLTLSDDGNELTGDFRGEAAVERGPVLWLASASTTQAIPPEDD